MDLKTYAVYRKLTANSALLEHLAKNEPVPINVLESDIDELIKSLHNTQAEQLIADYPRYLQENVQLGTIKDGDNQFTINGEISEPVIQSIEILHDVDRKDVVSNFITHTMMDLNGNRDVKIENLSLSEAVDSFVELTKTPLLSDDHAAHVNAQTQSVTNDVAHTAEYQNVHDEAPLDDMNSFDVDDVLADIPDSFDDVSHTPDASYDSAPEVLHDNIPDNIPDNISDSVPDSVPDSAPEASHAPSVDLSFMDDELPPTNVELEPPIFESPDDDVVDNVAEDLPSDKAAFKKAYDYLVDELKSRNIDKRLPKLHLA